MHKWYFTNLAWVKIEGSFLLSEQQQEYKKCSKWGDENTETSANIRELPGGNGGSTREELANKFCSQPPLQPQYAKESQSSEITFSGQKEN